MKKAFTLVELLVVVVVIVTLMTITFRLAGTGTASAARNVTVNRMQRLENCLSGYYAAYGSYPPVRVHGSRDFTYKVDSYNLLQAVNSEERISGKLSSNWRSVEAACRSQPIDFCFPYSEEMDDYMQSYSQHLQDSGSSLPAFSALVNNSSISSHGNDVSWTDVQIYRYGVMSYLLPRYLVTMCNGKGNMVDSQLFSNQRSWRDNNQLPARFEDGVPYPSWNAVNQDATQYPWKIAALPSQAVTARWLPNLQGICSWITSRSLYGVDIRDWDDNGVWTGEIFSVGGYGSQSQSYVLDHITVKDGYGVPFYYYSLPPHQSYTLWSSGANERTFPPWVTQEELDELSATDRSTVQTWISDDIMHMSN